RQASRTTCASWRGGKPGRPATAGSVVEQGSEPAVLVAAAAAPDRGRVTAEAAGDLPDASAVSHGQEDTGVPDPGEGKEAAGGNASEDGAVAAAQGQGARLPATHGASSRR